MNFGHKKLYIDGQLNESTDERTSPVICVAPNRFYVQSGIMNTLIDRMATRFKNTRIGVDGSTFALDDYLIRKRVTKSLQPA